ncbi:pyridoxal-phosphate dependent enzyme [Auriculariales sp. MPI-PUGE-AT-0066]|nr:pyridoxal-phosphate dependent enzyme [Auriculariales sp. MPI-PUGE-AT-0066]
MEALATTLDLSRAGVQEAHVLVKPYVHRTPTVTSATLTALASSPQAAASLSGTEWDSRTPACPTLRLFFKCENLQRVGAFKARGAFHALELLRTDPEIAANLKKRGVVTHSSGNHAQALALAAQTHGIPAHIVMPSISIPSKIAGTKSYGANVIFSGSTAPEREAVVKEVAARTGAILVPPYDHPAIILGQGTLALELQDQVLELTGGTPLDAIIAPCGGGGMLSGIALACEGTGIRVFGSEPSFEGADDARRGRVAGGRITSVKTLTIADGLRTPLGEYNWRIISDPQKVTAIYAVTEDQIKSAMRLVLERMKLVVEPSACVPLAVALFNEDFRALVEREAGSAGWNLGVVFSGGNTTVESIGELFR